MQPDCYVTSEANGKKRGENKKSVKTHGVLSFVWGNKCGRNEAQCDRWEKGAEVRNFKGCLRVMYEVWGHTQQATKGSTFFITSIDQSVKYNNIYKSQQVRNGIRACCTGKISHYSEGKTLSQTRTCTTGMLLIHSVHCPSLSPQQYQVDLHVSTWAKLVVPELIYAVTWLLLSLLLLFLFFLAICCYLWYIFNRISILVGCRESRGVSMRCVLKFAWRARIGAFSVEDKTISNVTVRHQTPPPPNHPHTHTHKHIHTQ